MLTHPRRRLRHSPGMKIKRGTDANENRRSQPALAWDRMGTELVFGGGVLRNGLGKLFRFQLRPQRKEVVTAWRTANRRQPEPPAQR